MKRMMEKKIEMGAIAAELRAMASSQRGGIRGCAGRAGIPASTAYRMLSPGGRLSLDAAERIAGACGLSLRLTGKGGR